MAGLGVDVSRKAIGASAEWMAFAPSELVRGWPWYRVALGQRVGWVGIALDSLGSGGTCRAEEPWQMSGVKEGNVTVGRVLSGRCAGGHGSQVISELIPMVQKYDLNWVISKRKDPQSNPHTPPTVIILARQWWGRNPNGPSVVHGMLHVERLGSRNEGRTVVTAEFPRSISTVSGPVPMQR